MSATRYRLALLAVALLVFARPWIEGGVPAE
jgi:hypothetical protein